MLAWRYVTCAAIKASDNFSSQCVTKLAFGCFLLNRGTFLLLIEVVLRVWSRHTHVHRLSQLGLIYKLHIGWCEDEHLIRGEL